MALTYGTARIEDGYWVLEDLPPHACMRFKDVFPKTGRTARLPFKVKVSPASSADLEWFMARYPMEIAANDQAEMVAGRETQQRAFEAAAAILAPGWEPPPTVGFREGQALRPYQAQAVQLCMARHGLLLGDDLGLGKTFVGCGLIVQPGTLPCAVVTPVHLQSQWLKVVQAVTTLRVHVVKKMRPYDLPPADVYLFRYSQLRGWFDLFGSGFFRSVIFEEAHELRTGLASDKGRAAKQLAENADWRLGLTATPVIWLRELAALKPAMYTGSESPKQKADAIGAFVSGDAQVLIISLRAGAGIDGLQHVCSTVVAGELDWQPGVHNQLIGRLDREGQTEPVDAFFLIAQDGSDPPMVEVLGIKSSQAAAITDPLGQVAATPADEGCMRALVQRYIRPGDIPVEVAA